MHIISGLYHRRPLIAPKGTQTRPTSSRLREALFNICQNSIAEACFLDLFAGSGAMGFEALSRGAQSATFIDSHRESIRCIKQNASQLAVAEQCRILQGDVFALLQKLVEEGKVYDLIFADPPYQASSQDDDSYSQKVIKWIDSHPMLIPGGFLFIEEKFEHQPATSALKTLQFIDSRRMGPAALQRYQKLTNLY